MDEDKFIAIQNNLFSVGFERTAINYSSDEIDSNKIRNYVCLMQHNYEIFDTKLS